MPVILEVLAVYLAALFYVLYAGLGAELLPAPWGQTLFTLGIGVFPLVYSKFRRYPIKRVFLLALPNRAQAGGGALLALGMFILVYVVSILLSFLLPDFESSRDTVTELLEGKNLFFAILNIALLPAVCEELLCRGFLLSGLRSTTGRMVSVLLCGSLFGLLHMDPVRVPFTVAIGIGLSYAAWQTGSLLVPVCMHGAHNLALLLIARAVIPFEKTAEGVPSGGDSFDWWSMIIAGIILSWVVVIGVVLIRQGARLLVPIVVPVSEISDEPDSPESV